MVIGFMVTREQYKVLHKLAEELDCTIVVMDDRIKVFYRKPMQIINVEVTLQDLKVPVVKENIYLSKTNPKISVSEFILEGC